jgi:hypothetical protein
MTTSPSNSAIPSSADLGAAITRSGTAGVDRPGGVPVPEAPVARPAAAPGWRWRNAAFLLAGAAQLITISALVSADPLAASWSALLLAIAPAPLTAVTAFAPAPVARPAALLAAAALIIGIAGGFLHTGLLFVPALVALAVGGARLWRERP